MTNSTTDPKREPGYRGSLPPREDRLARPWILTVLGIFVLAIVLSVAGVPSRFIPDPTPLPTPSSTPVPSESPSAEPSASADASAEASASASAEASASGSVEPSPSQ
jgi:cytoskeletal protein RodZ